MVQTNISARSTKTDLYKAYQEMKDKYEQTQKNQLPLQQQEVEKKEDEKIIEKTANFIPENLENDIISLRRKVQNNLEGIKNELIKESKKLQDVRKAIAIENNRLEEVYNIKLANDTFQTLIFDYETRKKEVEKEKAESENLLNEEITNRKKEWAREQDEYKYNLKIERKKEQDEYDIKQAKKIAEWQDNVIKKEAELNEKEENLNKGYEEIENLKIQITQFPEKLNSAVENAKQDKEEKLGKEFDVQMKLEEQKRNAEKEVLEAKISSIQENYKNQSNDIVSLKNSLAEANQRAQNLATIIVENASGLKQQKQQAEDKKEQEDKE